MAICSSPSSARPRWPARIGLVTDYFPPGRFGGVGEIAAALRGAYQRLGIQVSVVTTGRRADGEEGVVRVPAGPGALGGTSFFLPLLLGKVDLIHIHQASVPGLYLAKALLGPRLPPIITTFQCSSREEMRQVRSRTTVRGLRVGPRPREYIYKYLTGPLHCIADRMAMRLSDGVTAVSRSCLADCRRAGASPPWGLWRIPNGVDTRRFRPASGGGEVRRRLGIGKGLLLLYVGTLRMRKGIHDLFPALREIHRTRPDARLLVVGGGRGYEASLGSLARRLGVQDRFILVPPVENESLRPFYDAADAVIIPSLFEGLPLVLLEAMAQARPIVASKVDGIGDVLEDGVTGYLVPPADPGAIARRVEGIARDPVAAAAIGREARRRVEALYSWDAIALRYLEIFPRPRGRAPVPPERPTGPDPEAKR